MRKLFLVPMMLPLLVAIAMGANANTVTYQASVPLTGCDWTKTLILQQFDPSMGTLNGVTLNLQADWQAWVEVENHSGATSWFRRWILGDATLSNTDLGQVISAQSPDPTGMGLALLNAFASAYDGDPDFLGADTVSASNTFSASGTYIGTSADLSKFTGVGTIPFLFTIITTRTDSFSGGNFVSHEDNQASGNIYVVYDFTPVPEPSSMAALSAGLLGLVGLVRRKRGFRK